MNALPADEASALGQLLAQKNRAARRQLYLNHPEPEKLLAALKRALDDNVNVDAVRAGQLAERAFELGEHLGTSEALALGHWCRGLGLTGQGEYQAALPHFESARSLYFASGLEVEAYRVATRQLHALATIGDLEGALALARSASRGLREHGQPSEAAKVENNLGIIQARLGQYAEAIETLLQARAAHARVKDRAGMAYADINLGDAYQHLDRFEEALSHLTSAAELFESLGQTYMLGGTLINLAMLHRREGRFSEVLDTLARAKGLFRELEHSADVALVQLEEARVRLDMNMLEESETLARMLVDTFAERDMHLERLEALTLLGTALAKAGDAQTAREALQEARQGWQDLGNDLQAAWTNIYLVNLHLAIHEDAALAAHLLSAARAVFEQQNSRTGQAVSLILQAQLAFGAGDDTAAQEALPQAESLALELGIPDLIIRSARLLGLIAARQGRPRAAETYFRRAISELENVSASLHVDDFKAAYFGEKLDVYGDLARLLIGQQRFGAAFRVVERSKSRALLDLLGRGGGLETSDPHILALREDLRAARAELNALYLKAEGSGPEGPYWEAVQSAEAQVTGLSRDIEQRRAERGGLRSELPATHELINRAEDTVILEYYALGDELIAFTLSSKGVTCVRKLGSLSEVEQHLDRLEFTLMRVAQGELYEQVYGKDMLLMRTNGALASLYAILIKPLGLELSGEHLVVVPYGPLHRVPFAGLFDGRAHLFERALVSLAPSAAVYYHCREQVHQTGSYLAAFGVPFEDIPAVREEIEAVTRTFGNAEALLGGSATLAAFTQEAPNADVLHIATHGVYRPDNPMFSGLRFSDGWLAARDLYGLELNASLVVLSACETGVSSAHASDEIFGLARGFFHAGAPTLVVSLWAIKDSPTAELMVAFYESLQTGLSAARALQNAQRAVKERYPNPYFWAAFNVLGDPKRQVLAESTLGTKD